MIESNPLHIDIVQVSVDDWSAIYVNGICKYQNHSADHEWRDIMREFVGIPIVIDSIHNEWIDLPADNEDLGNYGNRFPEHLYQLVEYSGNKPKQQ